MVPVNNTQSIFGRSINVGSTMIQVADYSFDPCDKEMTFGTSTTNSVHIRTIASDGMATRISGGVLQVGNMLVSINGR